MNFNEAEQIERRKLCGLSRDELQALQLRKLNELLRVAEKQAFYADRLADVSLPLTSLDQITTLPILTKTDMIPAHRGLPGRIFGLPRDRYTRMHQTSGTSGWPMPVYDTPQDWNWFLHCWQFVLDAANVTSNDVAMMAFSFGPFIGFWTANDALVQRGAMVVPGGGMSSEARLQMIVDNECTIVCCTPTYALHLVSVARENKIDLAATKVTRIIVAGEPGGSMPIVRKRIEEGWGAKVIDHSGASELGAWGFGSDDGRGMHVIESEFIAELLHFDDDHPSGQSVAEGETAELVLTNLGRFGGPAIRYRTGDIVQADRSNASDCNFLWLRGGVLGRADDMMVIRGVNVFPSSIEAIVREVDATAEFRIIATREDEMDQLAVEAELSIADSKRLSDLLRDRLALRVAVQNVETGTLPQFQAKARRLVDRRSE
ncbi:phenylacetate--CoA ligase family protein [Stieleria marina]|uniref:phenylacetate--CoA ligase family protein n=1 Tax=Stieleria marina TaxID=1930275 RepID=UPI003AF3A2BB